MDQELLFEGGLRLLLFVFVILTRSLKPFIKKVQLNEWPRYNFPRSIPTRIPERYLFLYVFLNYFFMVLLLAIRQRFVEEHSTYNSLLESTPVLKRVFSKNDDIEQAKCSSESLKKTAKNLCLSQKYLFFAWSLAIFITMLTTDITKNLVGRPRPDYLSRCKVEGFDPDYPNFKSLGLVPICTSSDTAALNDGRRSFPSGHASLSFVSSVFAALFVYHASKNTFLEKHSAFRILLSYFYIVSAIYCCITRYMDYMHHWEDLVCGSLIGTIFAIIFFFSYYSPSKAKSTEFRKNRKLYGNKALSGPDGTKECLLARNEVKLSQGSDQYKKNFEDTSESTQDPSKVV